MINNFKDFKNYVNVNGGVYLIILIINLVVFNFRIEGSKIFTQIILSILLLIIYIVILVVIVNFIDKEFDVIDRMIENKEEVWKDRNDFWKYTKSYRITQFKHKMMAYSINAFL